MCVLNFDDFGRDKANLGPNDLYIGRNRANEEPNIWANPFLESRYGREACIQMYRRWIFDGYKGRLVIKLCKGKQYSNLDPVREWRQLKGKNLVCWCAPQACHGDVLKSFLDFKLKGH